MGKELDGLPELPSTDAGPRPRSPQVFLDCDGVLADFDEAGRILWGEEPRAYEARVGSQRFWQELEDHDDFYRALPLMPDALALYDGVKHLNPTILTGCPRGNWAEAQKVDWAARHFPGVPIITCRSADKRNHAKPGDVLIDDWPQHRHRWIEHGGVFISHYDAASSLAALWAHYPSLRGSAEGVATVVECDKSREEHPPTLSAEGELLEAAKEVDRLMLVIECAVRADQPEHRPAVLSALKSLRAAIKKESV